MKLTNRQLYDSQRLIKDILKSNRQLRFWSIKHVHGNRQWLSIVSINHLRNNLHTYLHWSLWWVPLELTFKFLKKITQASLERSMFAKWLLGHLYPHQKLIRISHLKISKGSPIVGMLNLLSQFLKNLYTYYHLDKSLMIKL